MQTAGSLISTDCIVTTQPPIEREITQTADNIPQASDCIVSGVGERIITAEISIVASDCIITSPSGEREVKVVKGPQAEASVSGVGLRTVVSTFTSLTTVATVEGIIERIITQKADNIPRNDSSLSGIGEREVKKVVGPTANQSSVSGVGSRGVIVVAHDIQGQSVVTGIGHAEIKLLAAKQHIVIKLAQTADGEDTRTITAIKPDTQVIVVRLRPTRVAGVDRQIEIQLPIKQAS